jgi:hypothetical protein
VSLLPLTLVGLVARAFGWLDAIPQRRALALAVFSVFLILMVREAVAAIERLRGGRIEGYPRLLLCAVLALAPPAWQSVAGYGHIEQPIEIWLVLVAVRWVGTGRPAPAGLAFALAILSRSSAVLMAVPLGLATLRQGLDKPVRLFVAAAATGVAVLLPFYLADRADTVHSLFTYRGGLMVGAGSVWALARDGGLEPVIQHWDIAVVVAAVVLVNLWLATRPGGFDEGRLFAGMTLTAASFALLAKTVWPYYFFEMFVFGTVWAVGRWRPADGPVRIALVPIAISTFGLIAEIGSEQDMPLDLVRVEGAGMFAMVVLTAAWILWLATVRIGPAPGITNAAAAFQGHGNETAEQRAGPR